MTELVNIGIKAKKASHSLISVSEQKLNDTLLSCAKLIRENKAELQTQNKIDIENAIQKDLTTCMIPLPKHFKLEIKYKKFNDAYNASFYPGVKQISTDTVLFESDDYYEVLRAIKFIL